jgi:hypothetical protein
MGQAARVNDDATPLDAWGDLRIGDRVRQLGPSFTRTDTFVLVELWSSHSPLSDEREAVAVIRDARDRTYAVNVGQICRV